MRCASKENPFRRSTIRSFPRIGSFLRGKSGVGGGFRPSGWRGDGWETGGGQIPVELLFHRKGGEIHRQGGEIHGARARSDGQIPAE